MSQHRANDTGSEQAARGAVLAPQRNRQCRRPSDAGLVGLRAEVDGLTTAEVVNQLSALIELPMELEPAARWRMRFLAWELLGRLLDDGSVAA